MGALLLLGASACGDDDGEAQPDAQVADAQVADAQVADATTDLDASAGPDLTSDEAALVVYERIINQDAEFQLAPPNNLHVVASFMEAIEAGKPYEVGACIDGWYETTEYFPAAQNPDRVYLDVGMVTISAEGLTPFTGTPREFSDATIPPRDFVARQHYLPGAVSAGVPAGPEDMTDPASYMGTGDVLLDVEVAGSETYTGPTMWTDAVYLSSEPTLTPDPSLPISIAQGEPLELSYEAGSNSNMPAGVVPLNFAAFVVADLSANPPQFYVETFCTTEDSELTVPAQWVDSFIDGSNGPAAFILRGQLVHRVFWFDEADPSKGRFDSMAFHGFANSFAVSE